MTDTDIVTRLAREAGLPPAITAHPGFKHFARLMLAGVAEECAKVCEETLLAGSYRAQARLADAIRAKFKA